MLNREINFPIFIKHNPDYHLYKEQLINKINITDSKEEFKNDSINDTDWKVDKNIKREYLDLFLCLNKKHFTEVSSYFNCSKVELINYWFQTYTKNNYHKKHNHEGHYSCVFYVELPNSNVSTYFYKPNSNEKFYFKEIKEGDIILFPSLLLHESPVIEKQIKKIIISANMNFYG
jgi:hypothetical protein